MWASLNWLVLTIIYRHVVVIQLGVVEHRPHLRPYRGWTNRKIK